MKLTGNTDIEDCLQRLDKLTQEEVRMASAELLKATYSVEGKVQDVNSNVQDVGNKVQSVDDTVQVMSSEVQDIDDKLDHVNSSSSLTPAHHFESYSFFEGNQLRDSLLRWLSPPDPSTNHNIASKVHHDGTAQWFFQGSIFKQWKSADPFLWIHGKRQYF
jgi:hypothetical protein